MFVDSRLLAVSLHCGERALVSSRLYEGSGAVTSSKPNYSPKAPLPSIITLSVRASTYEFGRDTRIQSIALARGYL